MDALKRSKRAADDVVEFWHGFAYTALNLYESLNPFINNLTQLAGRLDSYANLVAHTKRNTAWLTLLFIHLRNRAAENPFEKLAAISNVAFLAHRPPIGLTPAELRTWQKHREHGVHGDDLRRTAERFAGRSPTSEMFWDAIEKTAVEVL